MPRYILKIQDGETDYYMEWSTVSDMPATHGMSLEEFREYYKEQYGQGDYADLDIRLARVEHHGSSAHASWDSAEDLIRRNQYDFTKEEIIEKYCRNREDLAPE